MNKKTIVTASIVIVLGILAIAQTGNSDLITGMFGYKMTGSYNPSFILGFVILKLIAISAVSFLFSAIFWYTHKLLIKKK